MIFVSYSDLICGGLKFASSMRLDRLFSFEGLENIFDRKALLLMILLFN